MAEQKPYLAGDGGKPAQSGGKPAQSGGKPAQSGGKPAQSGGKPSSWWLAEIGRSRKHWADYRERARKVIKRYRDEREHGEDGVKFNILYSNVETIRPAVYQGVPLPDIRRRFTHKKDALGKAAAEILQRSLSTLNEGDLETTLGEAVKDYTLPGFAAARVRYTPVMDGETILDEDAPTEYVQWDMFAMSRSPTWSRVWWVAFREDLTRDEFVAVFGKQAAEKVSFSYQPEGEERTGDADEAAGGKCRVWEVWNKRAKERFFVAEGSQGYVRDPEPDPLGLSAFFPCPRPLWALSTTGSLIPIPEYTEYQDLAAQLDDVTERISVLTSALRRRGVHDGAYSNLMGVAQGLRDNQFEAVDDWARLVDKGGIAAIIAEMPLDGIIKVLDSLYQYRDRLVQTIYEVTGMADVIRGASNPQETATAQQIKGRWAGLRMSERQSAFQRFARDLMRLKAEIVAEHFQWQTLAALSGAELLTQQQKLAFQQAQAAIQAQAQQMAMQAQAAGHPAPHPPQMPPELARMAPLMAQPTWEEVIGLLRSDKLRGFRVDVETDSTSQPDADEERQQRIDLVSSIANAVGALMPAVQQGMIPVDLARELIAFSVRAFKASPQVEDALESLGQQAPLPPQIVQAQQQIQAKERELAKREAQAHKLEMDAKDAAHTAQLERERAMRQESEADNAKRTLEMAQQFLARLDALEAKHDAELRRVVEQAEQSVEAALNAPALVNPINSQPSEVAP